MLLALLFQVVSSSQDPVVGLHPGEAAVELAAESADAGAPEFTFIHPRVLDARTSVPLEGVSIELFTEDGADPARLELCVARGVTGRDGSVRMRMTDGPIRADKARLSKAGYASSTFPASNLWDGEVRLFSAAPLAGRVLDLEGRPVAGATVHTRQTCKHAVPATSAITDEFGRWRLEDCPAMEQDAELEVLSMDHEPRAELDVRQLRGLQAHYGGVDLFVARRRPIALRCLDVRGAPMANRCIYSTTFPVQSAWTDAEGACLFPPLPVPREWSFTTKDLKGKEMLVGARFAHTGITTLHPFERTPTRKTDGVVRIELELPSPTEDAQPAPPVQVQTDDGEVLDGVGEVHLPRGHARVLLGGDFTGWREHVEEIHVAAEPVVLHLKAEREPRIDLDLPEGATIGHLVVQAGDDSCSADVRFVPHGVPITIVIETLDGELRRAELPPLEADAKVELMNEKALVRRGIDRAATPLHELSFVVEDAAGKSIPDALGRYSTEEGYAEPAPATSGLFVWRWMESTPFTVGFGAEGYCTATIEGVVPARDVETQHVRLAKRAHVALRGAVKGVELGGGEPAEAGDGGFDLDVAPGPLTLRVARPNAPPIAIDLVLADGEIRRLEIR
jgi:hypothetical protein